MEEDDRTQETSTMEETEEKTELPPIEEGTPRVTVLFRELPLEWEDDDVRSALEMVGRMEKIQRFASDDDKQCAVLWIATMTPIEDLMASIEGKHAHGYDDVPLIATHISPENLLYICNAPSFMDEKSVEVYLRTRYSSCSSGKVDNGIVEANMLDPLQYDKAVEELKETSLDGETKLIVVKSREEAVKERGKVEEEEREKERLKKVAEERDPPPPPPAIPSLLHLNIEPPPAYKQPQPQEEGGRAPIPNILDFNVGMGPQQDYSQLSVDADWWKSLMDSRNSSSSNPSAVAPSNGKPRPLLDCFKK